ncbi:hypothetical protein HYY75_08905 [bacterium]|nr:hypothetical protein [bacterium]
MPDETIESKVPRVLELLLKKSAIDGSFKENQIKRLSKLADELKLPICAEEKSMLDTIPENQLRMMIERTPVYPAERKGLSMGCLVTVLTGGRLSDREPDNQTGLGRRWQRAAGNRTWGFYFSGHFRFRII